MKFNSLGFCFIYYIESRKNVIVVELINYEEQQKSEFKYIFSVFLLVTLEFLKATKSIEEKKYPIIIIISQDYLYRYETLPF